MPQSGSNCKGIAIAETNIIPFPTSDTKELIALKKDYPELIAGAQVIFFDLLITIKPKLIIVHSKRAFTELVDLISETFTLDDSIQEAKNSSIEDLEGRSELFTIPFSPTGICTVMACRHLMYFGKEGNSYSNFLSNLERVVSSLKF